MTGALCRMLSLLALLAGVAYGHGAFPDTIGVLAPIDRPHSILLLTNFGLLVSIDDGAHWDWACEEAMASLVYAYDQTPPPASTLLAASTAGPLYSDDRGCSWHTGGGAISALTTNDVFADATDSNHVFAIASRPTDGSTGLTELYESRDSGLTYARLYTPEVGSLLTGVRSAPSDPLTVYLAERHYNDAGSQFSLLRSLDGGAHFSSTALTDVLTQVLGGRRPIAVRIAAVDTQKATSVYLRVSLSGGDSGTQDALCISDDGGQTFVLANLFAEPIAALFERANHSLVAATSSQTFVSGDSARSWIPWSAPHIRSLAEREGILYAATDNFADHFAVASSNDDGVTWRPLLSFDQIRGLYACGDIATRCAAPWVELQALFGIGAGDGGTGDGGALPDPIPGCSCSVGQRASGSLPAGLFILVSLFLWWLRKHPLQNRRRDPTV